jgi:hypothetical protein
MHDQTPVHGHGTTTVQGTGANLQEPLGTASNPTMGATSSTTTAPASANLNPDTAPPNSNNAMIQSDAPESSQKGNQKCKGKPYCYHYHTKGHTISVCTTVLSCEICYGDHVKKVCPNLKNLHSTAIPCGYVVQGLGFYFYTCCRKSKSSFR